MEKQAGKMLALFRDKLPPAEIGQNVVVKARDVDRKCGEAVETAKHVIFDCPALCRRRSSYLEVVQEEGRQMDLNSVVEAYTTHTGNMSVTCTLPTVNQDAG
nr:unnamed protein product [Callosobruchus chinensis]